MFVALSATWLGASNAVREIVKERHILRREVDAGLSPSAYVASKALVLGSVAMVQGAILALIACAGQQPPTGGALLGSGRVELAAAGALVGLAATALGLALSAVATAPDRALALLPMTLVTELALAGGWASDLSAPGLGLLRDLTGAHWGVDLIGATVAGDAGAWLWATSVLLALTALGALALAVSVTIGGSPAGSTSDDRDPAVVAAAPAEVTTAPVVTPPEAPVAAVVTQTTEVAVRPVTPAAPATTTAPEPTTTTTTTTTTAPPAPTPTTVAPTTATTYATPPPSAGSAAPSSGVTTASASPVAWWSPWFWMTWMGGAGQT